jgi:hypothetical protein
MVRSKTGLVLVKEDAIKNPAASGRGMEADLLPNPRIRITIPKLRRRAAGNMTHTRFNLDKL